MSLPGRNEHASEVEPAQRIAQLEDEVTELQKRYDDRTSEAIELERECSEQTRRGNRLRNQARRNERKYKEDIEEKGWHLDHLRLSNDWLDERHLEMQKLQKSSATRAKEAKKRYNELQVNKEELQTRHEELQKRYDEMSAGTQGDADRRHAESQKRYDEMRVKMEAKYQEAMRRIHNDSTYIGLKRRFKELQERQDLLNERDTKHCAELRESHEELQNCYEELQKRHEELQKSFSAKLDVALLGCRSSARNYEEAREEARKNHGELQQSHEELQQRHDELQQSHEELQQRHEELRTSYDDLRVICANSRAATGPSIPDEMN